MLKEDRKFLVAEWGVTKNGRRARHYRVTTPGRTHLPRRVPARRVSGLPSAGKPAWLWAAHPAPLHKRRCCIAQVGAEAFQRRQCVTKASHVPLLSMKEAIEGGTPLHR